MTTQDGLSTGQMVALATAGLALIGLGSWALGKEEKSPASMASGQLPPHAHKDIIAAEWYGDELDPRLAVLEAFSRSPYEHLSPREMASDSGVSLETVGRILEDAVRDGGVEVFWDYETPYYSLTPESRRKLHAWKKSERDEPAFASKLGSGARFKHLEHELAGKPGIYDPAGLAAAIGRKKYGAKKFAELGRKGKARHHK